MDTCPHLDAEAFVAGLENGQGALNGLSDDMSEVREIEGGKRKSIPDEAVSEHLRRGVVMKRPYIFLSAHEYEATFGKTPPKGKRANTIYMPN